MPFIGFYLGIQYQPTTTPTTAPLILPTKSPNPTSGETQEYTIAYPPYFVPTNFAPLQSESKEASIILKSEYDEYNAFGYMASYVVVSTLSDTSECFDLHSYPGGRSPKDINGVTFYSGTSGDGTGSRSWEVSFYRKIHEDTCYDISLILETFRKDEGADELLQDKSRLDAWKRLDSILSTFRFVDG